MTRQRPIVIIPHSPLAAELKEAAQIQAEMLTMLRDLEQTAATADPSLTSSLPLQLNPAKPGSWRHPRTQ